SPYRNFEIQVGVGVALVVELIVVTGEILDARGEAPVAAAYLLQLHAAAVNAQVEEVRLGDTQHVAFRAQQANLDLILAVEREVMLDGRAAARAEGQVLAHAVALHEIRRDRINGAISGDG